jgi:hypothetical protein
MNAKADAWRDAEAAEGNSIASPGDADDDA